MSRICIITDDSMILRGCVNLGVGLVVLQAWSVTEPSFKPCQDTHMTRVYYITCPYISVHPGFSCR